ncbi:MAG TPA: type II secretion system F family protein [Solirubrobacteraceae bacterium]
MTPAAAVAGLAAALGAVGVMELVALRAGRRRRRRGADRRPLRALGLAALRRLGRGVGPVRAPADLQSRLDAAGLALPVADLLAVKAGAALVALFTSALLAPGLPGRLPLVVPLAVPAAAFLAPDAWLRRRIRARARTLEQELPDLLDLVRVAVAAGLPAARALEEVGARHPGVLAAELRRAAAAMALGAPATDAYARLAARAPIPGIAALVAALARAARHGAPVSGALAAQAAEARAARARAAAEHAARAAPKIQLVIALLLVPSVLLLVAAALIPSLVGGP